MPGTDNVVAALTAGTDQLTTAAMQRMERELPWFAVLPARDRSAVGSLAALGVRGFADWLSSGQTDTSSTEQIFTSAPLQLAQSLTLEQTVDLVRTSIAVVEEALPKLVAGDESSESALRESLLLYSREVAFAAANVYARLAETRGAWDARIQAQLIDAIFTGASPELLHARATAAGWDADGGVYALVGSVPTTRVAAEVHAAQLQRTARADGHDAVVGIHGERLVVIVSKVDNGDALTTSARRLASHFGGGTVVCGPLVESLDEVSRSAFAALTGYQAARLVQPRSRLVMHDELLAARVVNGDLGALDDVADAIAALKADVRQTLAVYLERSASIESCARELFVHVNTVRYRLRQVTEQTGFDPADPTDALTLRLALMVARKRPSL